jgi:predicted Rossmann-fold nucleotide-binding protein
MIEIESLAELDRAVRQARAADHSMRGWQVQGLDLTGHEEALLSLDPQGALFLGCTLGPDTAERLRRGGAMVFPELPDVPFDPWRPDLYTPAELYDGLAGGYENTLDARVYAWSRAGDGTRGRASLKDLLAQGLHDGSIDDALEELTRDRHIVGVMGGHAVRRDSPEYAAAALLAHDLAASGLTVATGGGPGAREAANLGALLADHPVSTLQQVLAEIAAVPAYTETTEWAQVAFDSVRGLAPSGRSLGIPTWHYGHEPPNPFASAVAKYFRNAIREDILLQICRGGIVFLPGAAGTVQEIFQSACTNYYAAEEDVAPMVFLGTEHWTRTLPVWPLVTALAEGRPLARRIHLLDDPSQVPGALSRRRPRQGRPARLRRRPRG